jgi:hypothetical protein
MATGEAQIKVGPLNNKCVLSGIMFLFIGGVAIFMARDYPMGSALRMGPGYFPIVLGGIIIAFGVWEIIIGFLKPDPVKGGWSPRALVVLPIAAVIFGIMMERLGFIPALVTLIIVSAFAGKEFKLIEVLLLAVGLTIMCTGIFIYGLGLPYPLFQGH